ncbi:DNA-binding MurR/RpiR family transcriptional regulator [Streptomyces sp. 3330]|uniref:MurR/RpiR family transcriptional regulator n=1 Tax=Streptomyces sp. 3330 TaxID=2817755 RepID=UPI002861AF1D|nr:MurR/RpiR family transcriptional regulator [Streptomyces sp. 3330]MDR6980737.1 DNA-binding MurR/RpiR family transcriptional regulator [Streptomyces sp. 3330]
MSGTLADHMRNKLEELSPAERKVARVLLAGYPAAVFETVAAIAERAQVSTPTVLRCAARLGFAGFPDFQAAVRAELDARNASPVTLYETSGRARREAPAPSSADTSGPGEPLLAQAATEMGRALADTFTQTPAHDFRTAADLLSDPRRRIFLCGGRFTHLLAQYLALHLMQLRDQVTVLSERPVERTSTLRQLARRDVLVLFDYRRYENDKTVMAQLAKERSGKVIVFTDPWLSPTAAQADVVLTSQVATTSPYDSLTPTLAVIETLISAVIDRLGEAGHQHLKRTEHTAHRIGLV